MRITKQDIYELNLAEINSMTDVELEQFCETEMLSHFHSWLLPQLVAHFGTWTLVKDGLGLIDILATLKHNVGQDPLKQALWKLSRVKRSLLVPVMSKSPDYATLTPLVLMGQKRMCGIDYQQWKTLPNLEYVIEPRLWEAVNLNHDDLQLCCSLGSERLLQLRNQGLMQRTGVKAGQLKKAESTWSLTGMAGTEIAHLPKLTQTMLTQIWLAHPSLRTPYMILDPNNWDNLPNPLLTPDIFKAPEAEITKKQKTKPEPVVDKLPWM
jgi:hypothetical protein